MESLTGRVRSVIHKSDDFYIFSVEPSEVGYDRKVVCKGRLFGIQGIAPGVPLELFGEWTYHPKFGRQFDLHGWGVWANSESGVESFLRVCLGLEESLVLALVDAFSLNVFQVLNEEPERLKTVPGFDEGIIESFRDLWVLAQISAELSKFLADHDVTAAQMKALYDTFKSDSKRILLENPYRLLEVEGFHFVKVDEIAEGRGVPRSDPRRFEGAVLWVLREAASAGHLCVRRGGISTQLESLSKKASEVHAFEADDLVKELNQAVDRLSQRGVVKIDPDVGVYLSSHFRHEREAAEYLARLITPLQLDVEVGEFIASYETLNQIKLSVDQKQAIVMLAHSRVLVLTGLPGTGKTTVIRAVVSFFEQAGISFVLMAPTGIASKRLSAVTGHPAATIHRTFRYDGKTWGYDRHNKYPVGAVIVDEMSMVDQELFYRILDSLEEGTILVLVGDDAQLPSVGPGNVLRELIRCESVPTIRLTQIFRQAEQSDIILNSHRINRGESIGTEGKLSDSDFRFVPIADEDVIANLIVQMAHKLKARDANFQVLSPKYDGAVGVSNLNDRLREMLNPPMDTKKECAVGPFRFREGDRVMVVKNDYELGIYNGDMGKLMSIASDHFMVRVHGAGEDGLDLYVKIPRKEVVQKLRLAYAITVHKSQGSEFDTVILPMVKSQGRMLQRNLFYTAVTRAKKQVFLLGERSAVSCAIANDLVVQRSTGFERAVRLAVRRQLDGSK